MSGIETTLNGHLAVMRVSGAIDGDMAERLKNRFYRTAAGQNQTVDSGPVWRLLHWQCGTGKTAADYKRISSSGGTAEIHGASPEIQDLLRELRLDLLFRIA